MKLQQAPAQYSPRSEQELRNELDRRDEQNYKKRQHIDLDPNTYIIMTSANGSRFSVTVSDAGALVVTGL